MYKELFSSRQISYIIATKQKKGNKDTRFYQLSLQNKLVLFLFVYRYTKEKLCESCLFDNTLKTATHFCKSCKDPEPLCKSCAQQHTRQKATRGHEICNDLQEFHFFQRNSKEEYVCIN